MYSIRIGYNIIDVLQLIRNYDTCCYYIINYTIVLYLIIYTKLVGHIYPWVELNLSSIYIHMQAHSSTSIQRGTIISADYKTPFHSSTLHPGSSLRALETQSFKSVSSHRKDNQSIAVASTSDAEAPEFKPDSPLDKGNHKSEILDRHSIVKIEVRPSISDKSSTHTLLKSDSIEEV